MTPGISTLAVATGSQYEQLNKNGIVVNGKRFAVPLEEATSPAELIIVALKHQHRNDAVYDLKNLLGKTGDFTGEALKAVGSNLEQPEGD